MVWYWYFVKWRTGADPKTRDFGFRDTGWIAAVLIHRTLLPAVAQDRGPSRTLLSGLMGGWVGGLWDSKSISIDGLAVYKFDSFSQYKLLY